MQKQKLSQTEIEQIRRTPPRYLGIREAAAYLSVSEKKIRQDIYLRRIPALKLGGKILIETTRLDATLKALEV